MKKKLLICCLTILLYCTGLAQVGINTDNPNSQTGLHVSERLNASSTTPDKYNGVIIQRYTTTERDTNLTLGAADNGLTIFNKTTNCYNIWTWNSVSSTGVWNSLCGESQAVMNLTDCSSMSISASLVKDQPAKGQITLNVDVVTPGKWTLTTNTVNGVTFVGGGEFFYAGTQTITLNAQGVATAAANPATFSVTIGANTCSVNGAIFDIATYTMRVLSITPDPWNSNISSGSDNTDLKSKLTNTANFGPSGTVTVGGFAFSDFNVSGGDRGVELAAALEDANILWIGYPVNSNFQPGELNAINNWLSEKKGVAIFHGDDDTHNIWVTNLGYSSNSLGSATGFTGVGTISPIVGVFGNLNGQVFTISTGTQRGSLAGKGTKLINDVDDGNLNRMILNNNFVVIADIDLAHNAVISNGTTVTNNNDRLYCNVFEWAVKNAPLK